MRLSARSLLLLLTVLIIPFVGFLWWTGAELRPLLQERARVGLERQARLVAAALGDAPFDDPAADRLGAAGGLRVTLISPDGTVLGDSEVSAERLPRVENHANRPEVQAALEGAVGFNIRSSETVSLRLLYVAIPDPRGVVRVATPLSAVDSVVARSRQSVLAGGLAALVLLLLLAGRLLRFWHRPVERIQQALAALGQADYSRRTGLAGRGVLAAIGHAVDETASRVEEREAGLRGDRDDLEAVFHELEEGVALVDAAGAIRRANRAFERWLGRSGLAGERVATLFRDPANVRAVERALAGEATENECLLGTRTILVSARPYRTGALVVLRDLTRRRQLESVRQDFVANVSHELKTPLTSIRGFAEAIAEEETPPERVREFSDRILANVARMQDLVDDLLELSRIESGAWQPQPVRLDLPSLATEVWSSFQPVPEARAVELRLEVPDGFAPQADPDAVRQILRNLLDNALRYAPDGTAVVLRARREVDRDRVEVADEGPGIPEAHVDRVFERFYRVDAGRSRQAGGTGLGLSIVKHLVAAHGGEAGIESELGQGTTAWFALPAVEGARPTAPPAASAPPESSHLS